MKRTAFFAGIFIFITGFLYSSDIVWQSKGENIAISGAAEGGGRIALSYSYSRDFITLIDADSYDEILKLDGYRVSGALDVSSDGKYLGFYDYVKKEIFIYDIDEEKIICSSQRSNSTFDLKFIPGTKNLLLLESQEGKYVFRKFETDTKNETDYEITFDRKYDNISGNYTLSPDGKYLIMTTIYGVHSQDEFPAENFVVFVNLETGEVTKRKEHRYSVRFFDFSPDGSKMITVSGKTDGSAPEENALLWDLSSKEVIGRIEDLPLRTVWGGFSEDGSEIYCIYEYFNSLITYDTETLARKDSSNTIYSLHPLFRYDNKLFCKDQLFKLKTFDLESREYKTVYQEETGNVHTSNTVMSAISPGGKYALSASADASAKLWDFETGDFIKEYKFPAGLFSARFSNDGTRMIFSTARPDNKIYIKNTENDETVFIFDKYENTVLDAVFSKDDSKIASCCYDGLVYILNAENGEVLHSRDFGHWIRRVKFVPGTNKIGIAGNDRNFIIWDFENDIVEYNQEIFPVYYNSTINDIDFIPDGKTAALACGDGMLRMFDMESKTVVKEYQSLTQLSGGAVKQASFNSVDISDDGKYMIAALSKILKMWDLETENVYHVFEDLFPDGESQNFAVLNKNSNFVLSCTYGGDVIKWRVPGISSVDENLYNDAVSVFPNPADEILNIQISSEYFSFKDIKVLDVTGNEAADINFISEVSNNTSISLDVSNLESGVYFYVISSETKNLRGKFVILR